VAQPVLLGFVIDYFSGQNGVTFYWACWSAAGVCLCSAIFIQLFHPHLVAVMQIGMRARSASCTLMYKKVNLVIVIS
jgi:hypothetical protein